LAHCAAHAPNAATTRRQVGGSLASLEAHAAAVRAHPLIAGSDIDFKAAASQGDLGARARRETGFEGLKVAVCKVGEIQGGGRPGGRPGGC
jgi:hypothetical protein